MDEFIDSLLETWRAKGKFGLTLPFIVGALRLKGYLSGGVRESFRLMLQELQSASATFRLAHCDAANDLILAPVKNSPNGCKMVFAEGEPTALWVQPNLVESDKVDSIDLFHVLWEWYGRDLEANRYSCTNGKYHEYTPEDLMLIEDAHKNIA